MKKMNQINIKRTIVLSLYALVSSFFVYLPTYAQTAKPTDVAPTYINATNLDANGNFITPSTTNTPATVTNTNPSAVAGNSITDPARNPTLEYTLLEPLPVFSGTSVSYPATITFQQYVQYFFNLIIALAAAAAVFMITFGGFQHMTSYTESGKSAGLEKVKNAVYGLLLVLCSYLILRTIDPRLVAIPTTLVTPISVTYTNSTTQSLSQLTQNTLNDQGTALSAQISQTLAQNTVLTQQLSDLQSQEQQDTSQLATDAGYPGQQLTADDISSICSYSSSDATLAQDCANISDDQLGEQTTQGNITANTAIGVMNNAIKNCLNTGAVSQDTSNACQDEQNTIIANAQDAATAQLKALGQYTKAEQVISYGNYATTMLAINNTLSTTLGPSPAFSALVSDISEMNTAADAALGAVVGGTVGSAFGSSGTGAVVGTVAGFSAASYINGNMTAGLNAKQQQAAANAAAQIQYEADNASNSIQDPTLQAAFQSQVSAMIQGLGGLRGKTPGPAATESTLPTAPLNTQSGTLYIR